MKTFWMLTLSAVLLAVSAGVTNAADKKASKKGRSAARTVQPGSLPSVSDAAVGIERALIFDGAVLTQARAEQIAVAANFTLIDFHRCSTGENCAIFEVAGPNGRIFQYQVLGERCKLIMSQGTIAAGTLGDLTHMSSRSARKTKAARQSSGSAPAGSVPAASANVNPTQVVVEQAGNVTSCFGGYTVLFRARQENTLYADVLGFSTKVAQFYQTVDNGRWLDLFNMSSSNFRFQRVDSGVTDYGWAHETRYSNGTLRSGASEAGSMIASSGSPGQTAAALCGGNRDVLQASANVTALEAYAACKAIPLPGSATIGGELKLEPWGVGGSVSGSVTKTSDTCANFKDIALAKNAVSAASYYNDCMQHPGRYFPNIFPPEDGALAIDRLETAIKPQYIENGSVPAGGACPSSIVNNNVTVDMGDGLVCTADAVRYTCNTTTSGSCDCTDPKVEGAITCTGPARVGARTRKP